LRALPGAHPLLRHRAGAVRARRPRERARGRRRPRPAGAGGESAAGRSELPGRGGHRLPGI